MPLDRFASSSTAVDATRPATPEHRPHQFRSSPGSFDDPSPHSRSKRRHGPVLEPPVASDERSSSPRLHSTTSPSTSRRTLAATESRPSSTASAAAASGAAPTSARSRPGRSTPQRYASPPFEWPEDDISLPSLRDDNAIAAAAGWSSDALNHFYTSDDHFLSDLANNNYSSPSSYPPLTRQQPPTPGPQPQSRHHQPGPHSQTPGTHRAPEAAPRNLSSLSRSTTQNSASTSFDSARSFLTNATSTGGSFHETPQSSHASEDMPPTTRRQSNSNGVVDIDAVRSAATPCSDRRRRTSTSTQTAPAQNTNRAFKRPKLDDDDPFKDSEDNKTSPVAKGNGDDGELYMIDLTEPNEPPADPAKPSEEPPTDDNRTKLSAFQCAICMDDVTALTVTHCGHVYCAQCLHSSLHVETTKGKCPMCRSKLDMKSRDEYTTKTKGFYPLELKLMTRTRKGKRKAGTMS